MADSRIWRRLALGIVLALAVGLHFVRLDQTGYNLYYAAAVKSMLMSGRNLFFASFDPAGFVSVDKPALGLWVQAASAALLGLSGLSLILPQAIAGVLSVLLLYHLVNRVFGATAGVLAALVLAVTPISVAANRNNTMDGLLVLTSLLAAWAASLATERGRLRWLLACAALVGVGFNIKMLPAFWLLYLAAAPLAWWRRLAHLVLATVVLGAVSLAWIVAVDVTPPEERPYVGSSRNNSELELIVGHNGLARLGVIANWLGLRGRGPRTPGPPAAPPGAQPNPPLLGAPPAATPGAQPGLPPSGAQPNPPLPPAQRGSPARGLMDETGQPGALRLFNPQLAGQASWLLPLALLGLPVVALQKRSSRPVAREHQALLLWGAFYFYRMERTFADVI